MLLNAAIVLSALLAQTPPQTPAESQHSQESMWEVLGHFDSYPTSQPYAVADQLEARGATFRTAGFATPDPAEKVLDFYRAEFTREGLMVFEQPADQTDFFGLSTFDSKTGVERTVVAIAGHGGPTRVMLSISSGDELLKAASSKPGDQTDGLPIHPSGIPLRSDAVDGSRRTTTVSYHAKSPLKDVVEWVSPKLQAQGWIPDESTDEASGQTLRFRRGAEALEAVFVATGSRRTDVTYLHLH